MSLKIYHDEEMLNGDYVALFYGPYDEMADFIHQHNLPARVEMVPNVFSQGNPHDDLIPGVVISDEDPARIVTFMKVALNDSNQSG